MSAHFAFITDSHYHPAAEKDYGAPKMLTQSRTVLDAIVPAINGCDPEFIVHGGDLLCGGGSFAMPYEVYLQAIADVGDAFDKFAAPAYYIPGNHDCDAQEGSFEAFAQRFPIPQTLDIVEAAPRLRLALANIYPVSPLENSGGTWTAEHDQLLRQGAAQAQQDGCALILFIHPWIFPYHEAQADFEPSGFISNPAQVWRRWNNAPLWSPSSPDIDISTASAAIAISSSSTRPALSVFRWASARSGCRTTAILRRGFALWIYPN
jgi:hypothetical protein